MPSTFPTSMTDGSLEFSTWIERVPLGVGFAGRSGPGGAGPPSLDRIKTMKRAGWTLTVLTVKGERYVIVLGWRA